MNNEPNANAHAPVSVVIIAFNEIEVIDRVVEGFLQDVVTKLPGSELIVAEDGSTDGTSERLRELAAKHPAMRLLQCDERRGYLRALREAMAAARNDFILFCDASGKHDPADFWRMQPLMRDNDMIVGFKEARADPLYRIVMTRVFNALVRSYFGVTLHDVNCPLRLMRKEAYEAVAEDDWLLSGLNNFEMTIRMIGKGYRVSEISVAHFARENGPSRGLPVAKIPGVIWKTLAAFRQLKHEAFKGNS